MYFNWNAKSSTDALLAYELLFYADEIDEFFKNPAGELVLAIIQKNIETEIDIVRSMGRSTEPNEYNNGMIAQGRLDVLERLRTPGIGISDVIRKIAEAKNAKG